MPGLEDYASPLLRCAVFHRLNPGAQIEFSVIPMERAFPVGHIEYEGKATEAVKCEIVLADGTYIVAFKECDLVERGKPVPQTPEQLAKDESKCLGRALRTAGIPQRLSELKVLMQWITTMDGTPNISSSRAAPLNRSEVVVQRTLDEAFPGSTEVEDDSPDAGTEDPTPEQLLAKAFAYLNGADKQTVVARGREMGVNNVLRAGEHAETLLAFLATLGGETPVDEVEAMDRRNEQKRLAQAATLEPEEPF